MCIILSVCLQVHVKSYLFQITSNIQIIYCYTDIMWVSMYKLYLSFNLLGIQRITK